LENTVSKNTVSFENSKFPKLGMVSKSFLQELIEIRKIQQRMANRDLIQFNFL